jgi:hypothetical protein
MYSLALSGGSFTVPGPLRTKKSPPENVSALTLLQMVYRGALKVSPQQMRAAIESLPYEKLFAMAVTSMSANDFAKALDRCIERSSKAKLIELKSNP